ncbi:carbohydrate ABC transporter membrane protein 1 (CUT1 family) [Lentzea atacamensis]|uniref:Carbohydrate ABC transporter membrane protein 1 (CUT1 family) n=1 Tax=Lentzea atacamensis TaxID=531938 RepID=A0A316HZP5_9PSEU|nr:sugar ABC transporter permease [Lentzea atacamensis]PWK83682.1 carbohydrate ABC transporter membrane protein 1 (CUT1 family) [Lentzea atacamensis]RAS70351.1 carbohydrate ABC transporter membrane protein 1 (CUT1 family) [Lentzea atacamensis]
MASAREARAGWLFVLPWVAGFLLLTAGPMLYSLFLSFTHYDLLKPARFAGMSNYREMLQDERAAKALWNTVFFTLLHVPLQIVLALGLASLLRRAGRSAGFFRTVLFLPTMTPPVALAALFLLLLNGQNGAINAMLGWFGFTGPQWTTDPAWIKPGLVLMSLWTAGSTAVLYLAALTRVPGERYEAARLDGASPWRQFWHVTLPGISGTVYFTLIVNTIASLQVFTEAYTMFFGARPSTPAEGDAALFYVIYLFQEAFGSLRMGYASALAWVLFLVIAAITALQVRLSRDYVHYEDRA